MPSETLFQKVRRWAREIKRDVLALWLAASDPRVPWHIKALCAAVAGYALSPIDLIPDFIPVLGYLDDVILLPLAIWVIEGCFPRRYSPNFEPRPSGSPKSQ